MIKVKLIYLSLLLRVARLVYLSEGKVMSVFCLRLLFR